jgi:regulation of enolase protein 1 (concanavalin A-like superfamily)
LRACVGPRVRSLRRPWQGFLLSVDEPEWIELEVETFDGVEQLGVVVASHIGLVSRRVRVRLSRSGDAILIKGRVDDEAWQLVRVDHLDRGLPPRWACSAAAPPGPGAGSPSRGTRDARDKSVDP